MKAPKTLQDAIIHFADAENCRQYMVAHRWPNGVFCPTCGRKDVSYLATQKKWQCKSAHAKRQFSAKVGTIFEDSPLGLEKWLPAVWLIVTAKNGISSHELARSLGVTQKTAWFMLHRIREAMKDDSVVKMGGPEGGPVEVDESYVGGNPKNRHNRRADILKATEEKFGMKSRERRRTGRATEKTPVFGMLDRETRQVRATTLFKVRRDVLMDAILANVEKGSTIYSDGLKEYRGLDKMEFFHEAVNHVNEYVRGQVHTQGIENFWSLLKRGLKGTYVAVEPFHLDRYVSEQVFRFNNRATKDNPITDEGRFALAISQIAGRRLTYAEVTGKVGETAF